MQTNGSGGTIDASTGAYVAGSAGSKTDIVRVADSAGNIALALVTVTAGVSISPSAATVHPMNSKTFTASGGSGGGWAWSLAQIGSPAAHITSAGVYTAGIFPGTDIVKVVDSLGNSATATVTVQ